MQLRIGSVGMVTPLGFSSAASCAAIAAGISAFEELPLTSPLPQPLIGAFVPTLRTSGVWRLSQLLAPAIAECCSAISRSECERTPLLVGVADAQRPDRPPRLDAKLIEHVCRRLNVSFHPRHSKIISRGRASIIEGLAEARRLLQSGQAKRCIVAGVDSFIDHACLGWLFRSGRLKLEDNPDGLVPGEAASALEVLPANQSSSGQPGPHVLGLGFGEEPNTVLSDRPNLAAGLTTTVREALADANTTMSKLDFRLSDVTGEQYYFRETANALARILREHKESFPIWHCADSIGDVGAAVGGVLIQLAGAAFRKGYAPGPLAICQTSSDFGPRAAAILSSQAE